jgi:hypothetical protein
MGGLISRSGEEEVKTEGKTLESNFMNLTAFIRGYKRNTGIRANGVRQPRQKKGPAGEDRRPF